jgi:hypothetical protein
LGARLFVDNLPPGTTEEALKAASLDRQRGDLHDYALVEMASGAEARPHGGSEADS